jgi:GNAT superfamily N-acetyltransferase
MIVILILVIIYIVYDLWIYFSSQNHKDLEIKKIKAQTKKISFEIQDKVIIPLSHPIKSNYGCYHYADIGLACPTEVHSEFYDIMPYQYINNELQEKTAQYLQNEWGNKKTYTVDTILEEWPLIDALYVMTYNTKQVKTKSSVIGCVAIDRKYFFPFISHLYVLPELRGKGYGAVLIDFALKTVKILGFNRCKLWCDQNQINYYIKKGWTTEVQKNDLYIMSIKV